MNFIFTFRTTSLNYDTFFVRKSFGKICDLQKIWFRSRTEIVLSSPKKASF